MKSSNWSTYWCLQVSFFILVIPPGASSSLAVAVPESCSMKEENKVDWKTDRNTHRKHVAGCNFVEKETSTQVLFWILFNYLNNSLAEHLRTAACGFALFSLQRKSFVFQTQPIHKWFLFFMFWLEHIHLYTSFCRYINVKTFTATLISSFSVECEECHMKNGFSSFFIIHYKTSLQTLTN